MPKIPTIQIRRSLARSTWVTDAWNWLLTLVSRTAEAILTVTILYSTMRIFTQTNPHVDLAMFLAQQIALDAGGIGLIKMANQAKNDGQQESARKARTVATILMVLMGIGVVISEVESKLTTTETIMVARHLVTTTLDFQQAYPGIAVLIEILLLIARGSMAIVYGFTIHDLESAPSEARPTLAVEVEELVRKSLELFQEEQQQLRANVQEIREAQHALQHAENAGATNDLMTTVRGHLHSLFAEWKDEALQRVSPVDEEALLQRMDILLTQKAALVQQTLDAKLIAAMKQQIQQVEADLLHRVSNELVAWQQTHAHALVHAASPTREPPPGASPESLPVWLSQKAAASSPPNLVDLPLNASRDEVLQRLEADPTLLHLSDRSLAKKVGTTASTARRAKAAYGGKHPESLHTLSQDADETRETDEIEAV